VIGVLVVEWGIRKHPQRRSSTVPHIGVSDYYIQEMVSIPTRKNRPDYHSIIVSREYTWPKRMRPFSMINCRSRRMQNSWQPTTRGRLRASGTARAAMHKRNGLLTCLPTTTSAMPRHLGPADLTMEKLQDRVFSAMVLYIYHSFDRYIKEST
jgi:hypothetical protein